MITLLLVKVLAVVVLVDTGTGVSSPKSTTHNNPGGAGRANTYAYGPTSAITFSVGGGAGPTAGNGDPAAMANTGGGGGGGANPTGAEPGGTGGSGMVIVRYKIGTLEATAKATGGAISFYNGKTIHTFVASGSFVTPGSFNETVEYVVVGGGGGSGYNVGGGGGAGGVIEQEHKQYLVQELLLLLLVSAVAVLFQN